MKPAPPHPLKDIPSKPWLDPKTALRADAVRIWSTQAWRSELEADETPVIGAEDHFQRTSELARRLLRILYHCGSPGRCEVCNVPLLWVTHTNGKNCPYTLAGLPHWVDCLDPERFHKSAIVPK